MKNKVFIIAEIAQAHEGSLGIAHSYIDVLADLGADAVKFQMHIAEAESSIYEPFRVKFSFEDQTRYDYWKRMEFTVDQWVELKQHCDQRGVEFLVSPFSCAAVDILEKLKVKRYKIGSGEVTNYLILKKIALTGKPIILSSGLSDYSELDDTIAYLKQFNSPVSILQCATYYPTLPEQWGLNEINNLKKRYNLPIGFSDHSSDIFAGLSAVALGAEIIEFHIVFDKQMFGPDAKASLIPSEAKKLIEGIRKIEIALQNSQVNKTHNDDVSIKKIFGKSLCVNKNISKGHIIGFEDLESKKPADKGIAAIDFEKVLGKTLNKNLNKWDFINYQDIS